MPMFIINMYNLLFSFCLFLSVVVFTEMQPLEMAKQQPAILKSTLPIGNSTDSQRFQTFVYKQNKNNIDLANSDPNKTYKLEANAFAALTEGEIKQKYLSLIPSTPTSIKFAKGLLAQKKTDKLESTGLPTPVPTPAAIPDPTPPIIPATIPVTLPPPSPGTLPAPLLTKTLNSLLNPNSDQKTSNIQSADRTLVQTQYPDLSAVQNEVLGQVKQFLKKKNVPNDVIQNSILPQGKYQGPLVSNTTTGKRLLQSILLNDTPLDPLSSNKNSTLLQQLSASSIPLVKVPQNATNKTTTIIKDIDWTCLSGRVKAQGDCGACYAFATADNVGALLGIYYYTFFVQLSVQEIIDCTQNSLVYGCNGGFLQGALAKMVDPGTLTEYTYPYSSLDLSQPILDKTCKTAKSKLPRFSIDSFEVLPRGDCQAIKARLMKSPISVGISGYKLAFYGKGVFDGCDDSDDLDHAALLVGFVKDKGWKIKNSWGTRWGQNGFAWIKDGNTCKICQIAFYPIPSLKKGYQLYMSNRFEKTCPPP